MYAHIRRHLAGLWLPFLRGSLWSLGMKDLAGFCAQLLEVPLSPSSFSRNSDVVIYGGPLGTAKEMTQDGKLSNHKDQP